MARKLRDATPMEGELRRAYIGIYLPPSGYTEEALVCSICVETTQPLGKRMAAIMGDHNFCVGCGCRLVP